MTKKFQMKRYLNTEREKLINERVHSEDGREALKLIFVDGKKLWQAARLMDMNYNTFTWNYYNKWTKELFEDFDPVE